MNYLEAPFRAVKASDDGMLKWTRPTIASWLDTLVQVTKPGSGMYYLSPTSQFGGTVEELLKEKAVTQWQLQVSPRYGDNEGVIIEIYLLFADGRIPLAHAKLFSSLDEAYGITKVLYMALYMGLHLGQIPMIVDLAKKVPSRACSGSLTQCAATGGVIQMKFEDGAYSMRDAKNVEFHRHTLAEMNRTSVQALAADWDLICEAYGIEFVRYDPARCAEFPVEA